MSNRVAKPLKRYQKRVHVPTSRFRSVEELDAAMAVAESGVPTLKRFAKVIVAR